MKNLLNKFNTKKIFTLSVSIISIFTTVSLFSCNSQKKQNKSIAVFVPGIIEDSPIYANLVKGVESAVTEYNQDKSESVKASVYIFEAGTNQSQWQTGLTALAASQKYDVIFSSNPSMPDLALPLTSQFPEQKFIFLDAFCKDNNNIATVNYKQDEAAFLCGYMAALMSKSKKIGLISAQEYPVMNNIILPNYERGAKAVDSSIEVDFRIVGNWYDAKKGAELADAMSLNGVDVILPICGGACQGVLASAKENKFYLCAFDSNTYASVEGQVIACVISLQEKLAKELTLEYLQNQIQWGSAHSYGIKDGYVKFVDDDPIYLKTVPEDIQQKIKNKINELMK